MFLITLKRSIICFAVVGGVASCSSYPETTLYVLEGASDSDKRILTDCLGQLGDTISMPQLQILLDGGSTVVSPGGDSRFKIIGKLVPGEHTCFTKQYTIRAPKSSLSDAFATNASALSSEVDAINRANTQRQNDRQRAEELRQKQIESMLDAAY